MADDQSGSSWYVARVDGASIALSLVTFEADDCTGAILSTTPVGAAGNGVNNCGMTEMSTYNYFYAEISEDSAFYSTFGKGVVVNNYNYASACSSRGFHTTDFYASGACASGSIYTVVGSPATGITVTDYENNDCTGTSSSTSVGATVTCQVDDEDGTAFSAYTQGFLSPAPTYQATMAPTPPAGSSVIEFSATIGLNGVSSQQFNTDLAAQQAAINATASSMPGVYASQVSIASVTDTSRRMLISGVHRELTSSIAVTFNVSTTQAQIAAVCASCTSPTAAFSYMQTSLNTALANGTYTSTLQSVSIALGATVTQSVTSSTTAVYTTPVFVVTPTAAPTSKPGSNGITDGGIAGAVIGSVFGFALICAVIYFLWEKGIIGGAKPADAADGNKDHVLQMHNKV
jgi:hypothetical protein